MKIIQKNGAEEEGKETLFNLHNNKSRKAEIYQFTVKRFLTYIQ
jgi:hypothetical protein